MEADRRRQRAVDAALAVAHQHGLANMDPTIVHDSNNTVVHLRPYPIVAKVGTTPLAGRADGLRRELRVLVFLAAAGAPPTVRPVTIVPPGSASEPLPRMRSRNTCRDRLSSETNG